MTEIDGYEVLGLGLYFEDLPVGRKFRTIGRTLTEADLVAFIGVTGMTEVLFSNIEFLENESDIKQRVVPAAMVYSFAEGLLVHATMQHTGFAFLNMELNVNGPTFAGDTIHVECEVIESRRSNSRPEPRAGAHQQPRREAGRQRRADLHPASHGEGAEAMRHTLSLAA